ncbi:glycosyl hydrolase family 12 [Prauserella shujinwangii]|uniref:Glycosyl hydrolase family 12 n=1 Tax=Prauserella shujinwangii TaxID=1453103 RepID=A0A2T0M414_9PSEU|nr:glycoside hydrolase [Prauserella shujinwangii]PRX51494.1 glycosyl hydrolase family 12 [Prauserella shujinwangii]
MFPRTTRRGALSAGLAAFACAALVATAPAVTATATAAVTESGTQVAAELLCGKYDSTRVQQGRYIVQNNVWGADTAQCIDVGGTGASFAVTTARHDKPTNGAPAAYPSVYAGCHYQNCTTGSGLPLRVDAMRSVSSSWSTSSPDQGVYNVAYDLWFDPQAGETGQNEAELMIWLKHRGSVQPVGSRVDTVRLAGATWDVWQGNPGWNVISFVRTTPTDAVANLDLTAFTRHAVERGAVGRDWYLTSVQAGFEPWQGGAGLRTHAFSVSAG